MAGHPPADPAATSRSNPAKFASDKLTNQQKLALSRNPHGSIQALFEDCVTAAADRLIADHGGPAWDEESFRKLYDAVRADLVDATRADGRPGPAGAGGLAGLRAPAEGAPTSLALLANVADVKEQLAALDPAGLRDADGAAAGCRT